MSTSSQRRFETLQVHGEEGSRNGSISCSVPIDPSAPSRSYKPEDITNVSKGIQSGFLYSRFANPTVEIFEKRIAALEAGKSAVAVSSGTAAVLMTVMALAKARDNIISSRKLYNGTFSQFDRLLPSFGVTTKFIETSKQSIGDMIDARTKLIFSESVSNPQCCVADYDKLVSTVHEAGIPVVNSLSGDLPVFQIDATITAAGFFGRPIDYGVDIVIHSATKWISGHGTTLGGIIIDSGKFNWSDHSERFPQFHSIDNKVDKINQATLWNRFGPETLVAYLRFNMLRDFGSTLNPFAAQQMLIGMETLSLRCERQAANAMTLSKWLGTQSHVAWISYIGLEQHHSHRMANKYLKNGWCSVISFGLVGGQSSALKLIDGFKMIINSSNVGDSKTIVGHPWSTTNVSMTVDERVDSGVTEDLIRISTGTENIEDIIDDFRQSFRSFSIRK
ncbi:Homocysteine synthase [Peltigera leucophlebia]|nr:Homocysteine synthase [Peltigera leucophlebia]